MRKFYRRLLFTFILFILFVNVVTALISLNPRQLINFAFYDTRTIALVYLVKNIVVESGIRPHKTTVDELVELVTDASEEYCISSELLKLLTSPNDDYKISLTGGMGLTRINPYAFFKSGYKDPYLNKDNIYAAASLINELSVNRKIHESELPREFLSEGLNTETIRIFSKQTAQLIYLLTKKYNDYINSLKEDNIKIDLFSTESIYAN